jgi:hypothetical protein
MSSFLFLHTSNYRSFVFTPPPLHPFIPSSLFLKPFIFHPSSIHDVTFVVYLYSLNLSIHPSSP